MVPSSNKEEAQCSNPSCVMWSAVSIWKILPLQSVGLKNGIIPFFQYLKTVLLGVPPLSI
jgi:hypothetical protein